MEVKDFAAVYELGLRCYKVTDKPYNYWSLAEVADHLQRNPELCLVADVEGDVAGFILGDATFEIIEDTAHLEWLAVSPEHRRRAPRRCGGRRPEDRKGADRRGRGQRQSLLAGARAKTRLSRGSFRHVL